MLKVSDVRQTRVFQGHGLVRRQPIQGNTAHGPLGTDDENELTESAKGQSGGRRQKLRQQRRLRQLQQLQADGMSERAYFWFLLLVMLSDIASHRLDPEAALTIH